MTAKPLIILNGRSYPLFKRGNLADSPFCVRVQAKGIRRALSTGTADVAQAKERAKMIVESALAGDWQTIDALRQPRQRPKNWPTIDQLIKAAATLPKATVPIYCKALVRLASIATGQTEAKAKRLTLDVLTAPFARAFQAEMQGLPKADPLRPTAKNATANSILINAQSLFSRKALAHYDRINLAIPDLRPFLAVPLLTVEKDRYSDNPISDTVLREIDTALPSQSAALRKAHDSIRLHGRAPGTILKAAEAHARFLKRWGLTPSHLWHHAAASMLRRTGNIETVATWAGMSITAAKWHLGTMAREIESLRVEETYLGV